MIFICWFEVNFKVSLFCWLVNVLVEFDVVFFDISFVFSVVVGVFIRYFLFVVLGDEFSFFFVVWVVDYDWLLGVFEWWLFCFFVVFVENGFYFVFFFKGEFYFFGIFVVFV